MFRLFGFRESARRVGGVFFRVRRPQAAAYAEALQAGWVSPLPENQARNLPAEGRVDEKSDIAAFLARVYRNQQC